MGVTHELELIEPVIDALLEVFRQNQEEVIEKLNEEYDDGIELTPIPEAQYYDYRPTEATWEKGLPCVGVAELPSRFEDDNVSMLIGVHTLCVWVVVNNADHGTLAKLLRRYTRMLALCIQKDRAFQSGPGKNIQIMSRETQAVWGTKFEGIVPGDMLEERPPDSPSEPPTSYLSWRGIIIALKREEI